MLSSKKLYDLSRGAVLKHVTAVLRLRGLKLPGKGIYRRALGLYASTTLDFVDVLGAAQMERAGIATIISFDKDFDGLGTIRREEPTAAH